jgi:hypothetical protein
VKKRRRLQPLRNGLAVSTAKATAMVMTMGMAAAAANRF